MHTLHKEFFVLGRYSKVYEDFGGLIGGIRYQERQRLLQRGIEMLPYSSCLESIIDILALDIRS